MFRAGDDGSVHAEQLTDPVTHHGEGPVFSSGWGGLALVDMLAGDVLFLAADGGIQRVHVGQVAAVLRPRRGGGAVIGVERGFALLDPDGSLTRLPEVFTDRSVRMNEGGCDPAGGFYCGSMAYDQRAGGGLLYRLDPDGTVATVLDSVTVSNGLDWSPDGSLAYYNDTATHRVDVFDWDPVAGLTGRRPLVELGDLRPDGLTVDSRGGVWTALYGHGEVRRYTPDGRLEVTVQVPTASVTACTLGGPDRRDLFITTSKDDVPDTDRLAGAVFTARADVPGMPAREFAG